MLRNLYIVIIVFLGFDISLWFKIFNIVLLLYVCWIFLFVLISLKKDFIKLLSVVGLFICVINIY